MLNAQANEPVLQRPKVLIADDDPNIVGYLASRCAKLGLEVQTATNGLNALVVAQRVRPDVLIVDVNMPEVDGLSLCFHLLRPEARGLDVIVVTGKSDQETIERCEGFGARYARKGPDLWLQVQMALSACFPQLARAPELALPLDIEKQAPPARPRILIVDDDPEVGQFLGSRLRKLGVDPVFAGDGHDGYRLALREKPSVIISDCYMQNGDISYLLWRLRSTPETEKIPVLAMSARKPGELEASNLLRDILGRQGPAGFFQKQPDMRELFEAVGRFCRLSQRI